MANEAILVAPETATAMRLLASKLAQMEGTSLSSTVNTLVKQREDWEGGPFRVMFGMHVNYPANAGEGKLTIMDFPNPNAVGGNKPGKWKESVEGARKDREKTVNFYDLFVDSTAAGVRINQELGWLKRLEDTNDNHKGIDPAFVEKYEGDEDAIEALRGELSRRLGYIKSCYQRAVALDYKLSEVNALRGVVCRILYKDGKAFNPNQPSADAEVESTREPIVIQQIDGEGNATKTLRLSLASFLRLDTEKAKENANVETGEGMWKALKNTLKRTKPGQGQGNAPQPADSDAKPHYIGTADTFLARATDMHEYMDRIFTDTDRSAYLELKRKIEGAGSDEAYHTAWALRDMLNDILPKGDKAQARFDKIDAELKEAA